VSAGAELIGPFLGLALVGGAIGARHGRVAALIGASGGFGLGFLPVNAIDTVASFSLGVLGPASASFLALSLIAVLRILRSAPVPGTRTFAGLLVVAGVALYPSAMGYVPFDLYREGFAGVALPLALALVVAVAVWRRATALAIWFAMIAAVIVFRLHPSANLWDAMIDVPSVLIAAGVLVASAARRSPASS
jgi:hypothetical protein